MCGNVKDKPSKLPNTFPYFWELEVLGCLKSLDQGFGRMQIGPSLNHSKGLEKYCNDMGLYSQKIYMQHKS